jgi:hypothetical protein
LGLFAAVYAAHSLAARGVWEADDMVEICVDGEEVRLLSDAEDDRTFERLADLKERGVSSVAVYWDPSTPLRGLLEEWENRLPADMAVTLRPEAVAFSDWMNRWPRSARLSKRGDPVANVLFSGASVMGYPDLAPVEKWLAETPYRLPWVEFGRQRGMRALQSRFPERMVRAHTLGEEEMVLAGTDRVLGRLRRAVRERGARFLFVHLFPGLSYQANMDFVKRLADTLRSDGWRLGPAVPRYGDWPRALWPLPVRARQTLAFATVVFGPLIGFWWALRRGRGPAGPLAVMGASLASGLLAAAFLSTPDFALGFEVFRGVKVSLLAPLGAALFLLYQAREVRHFFRERVTVGRLTLGIFVLGSVAYYVLRSGHGTAVDATGMELTVRGWLESVFGVRPRFKEFLVGHPLLLAGFYLRERLQSGLSLPAGHGPAAQALHFALHDPRPFLLVGLVGSLSIVNTFCHAHTPLAVSFLRTFHGLWLGGAGGAILVGALRWAEPRWNRLP